MSLDEVIYPTCWSSSILSGSMIALAVHADLIRIQAGRHPWYLATRNQCCKPHHALFQGTMCESSLLDCVYLLLFLILV